MCRFIVVSGFLGAGKTTTMMAVERYMAGIGQRACMISNDLGGRGLADYRYSHACGCSATELTGECICYQTKNLADCLERLLSPGQAQLVMSDIPGFGVGALDHVYHRLWKDYPGQFTLGPFTVITEGDSLCRLLPDSHYSSLPDELQYILDAQLKEADLLVLNKCDLLSPEEKAWYLAILEQAAPGTPALCISALTGEGVPELTDYLFTHDALLKRPEIGYGGAAFSAAMGKISEYNCQYYAQVCCETFDANVYFMDLAREIRDRLKGGGKDIPHLKLFGQGEDGEFAKADLLGVNREPQLTHAMASARTDLPVVLNASAACPCEELGRIIDGAIGKISEKYNLWVTVFARECFGIGDGNEKS